MTVKWYLARAIRFVGMWIYHLGNKINPPHSFHIIESGSTNVCGSHIATYWTIPGGGKYIGSLRCELSDGTDVTVDMGSLGQPVGLQIVNCNGIKALTDFPKLVRAYHRWDARDNGEGDTNVVERNASEA